MEKTNTTPRTGRTDLINLDNDCPVRIVEIAGGHMLEQRLNAMGFAIGSVLVKKNSFYAKGPIIIKTGQTTVALGRGMAQMVIVEPVGAS